MSIFSKFLPKKDKSEYFLTLAVEDRKIRAAITLIHGNQLTLIGTGESDYSQGENESEAADIAISCAEKNVPENYLVEKVVFALPFAYLEGDKVKPEYLERLKKITKDLALEPQGFVEYPDAITYYLQKEEGSPPTSLILCLTKETLTLTLVRVGKIQHNFLIPRTSSVISDIEAIIPDLKADILPSRIIIYDEGENLEEIRENLLRLPWNKHPEFLHTPKIEILSSGDIMTALIEAAGTSFMKTHEVNLLQADFGPPDLAAPHQKEPKESSDIQEIISVKDKKNQVSIDEEITDNEEEEETFGFTKDNEIAEKISVHQNITLPATPAPFMIDETVAEEIKEDKPKKKVLSGVKIPDFFNSLLLPVILLLIILGLSGWFFFTYPKADVSIFVYPQINSKNMEISIFTQQDSLQNLKNYLIAEEISVIVEGEKNIASTGKTKVGEKAKGTITVYNKTFNSKTLPKGAILQNGSLTFNLDENVNIASASDTGEGLAYGKTTAKVTSNNIGPESNLSPGSNFTFKDFPENSLSAKNETALTGGTSREAASISKDDRDNLEEALTSELMAKAKQELNQKIKSGAVLIDQSLTTEISSKKFSAEMGSEAKEVSLTLSLKVTGLSYNSEELISLSKENPLSVPEGFSVDESRTGARITNITKNKNNEIQATAVIYSSFIPTLNLVIIKKDITGKNYQEVVDYLKSVNNISGVKIVQINKFPLLSNRLPFNGENIAVDVVSF
ncbi:hypothetical protein A3D03_05825 [Candidatus Gottesmanbacteria bacterium RIFCSPHIGHO2_02_FULL_40_13]|uniref:Baseplate protein J-like domain-containing protein n=1 Tax=Candidatus Gottesmanbacteria bacterium RIFCSPHIGHO2_02_FULL_40_13 TaxID=1798384 RepID=A0A1F6A8U7_9BACT|nr:MAG: hypothetical protein A3D03_05825 [Candidatus Gottesmanbacteria bacterium RIFCSPHIGHO2_02_FULL_40_13]